MDDMCEVVEGEKKATVIVKLLFEDFLIVNERLVEVSFFA